MDARAPTFVVAEIGVNHGGSLSTALRLVDEAKEAGADAAKFQFFSSQKLWGDDRIQHLELRFDDLKRLAAHCEARAIEFMCTPFGVEELHMLKPLLKRVKVASGFVKRGAFLERVRELGLPVILSTGMSSLPDIREALIKLEHVWPHDQKQDLTLLHCTSSYPCPLEDVNLHALEAYFFQWGHQAKIGYSDHTDGITVAIAAVALGARMIEKHLTLDREAEGPDHRASIEPHKFAEMVQAVRDVGVAMGYGEKRLMPSERKVAQLWK